MKRMQKRFLATALMSSALFFAIPYASATVSVTFSESIEPKFSSLNVTDEQGKQISTASSTPLPNDPKTLTLSLPPLQAGGYLVHWVSVAADGHRMEGEYKFTVK
jgi:methionine-rich copper-binding protein CopC